MTAAELVCAGCGARGHPPRIVFDKASVPPGDVVIRPVFGWGDPPATAMLCDTCRAKLERRKRRSARP